MSQNAVRQNFHEDCEAALNQQINKELFASYTYLSMAYYFDRHDVALPGMHKYFRHQSDEEREHAAKLMRYQNERGGLLVLQDVKRPEAGGPDGAGSSGSGAGCWGSPLDALRSALELERCVNESLLKLHELAASRNDAHLCDYLESHFLNEQVDSIRELAGMITRLERCGSGLGEYMFDKHLDT